MTTPWNGVHVIPTLDTYEHRMDHTCACGVHCEGEHPSEMQWIHDSFDGREAFESRERKRS